MSTKKYKLAWESWNAIEDELIRKHEKEATDCLTQLQSQEGITFELEDGESFSMPESVIVTPFGEYLTGSVFKPSSRWECWICHTNFPISEDVVNTLNEEIEGIEALAILGAYTFCIGVAKLFDPTEIKREIEEKFCT
jgi:hypothetical protein